MDYSYNLYTSLKSHLCSQWSRCRWTQHRIETDWPSLDLSFLVKPSVSEFWSLVSGSPQIVSDCRSVKLCPAAGDTQYWDPCANLLSQSYWLRVGASTSARDPTSHRLNKELGFSVLLRRSTQKSESSAAPPSPAACDNLVLVQICEFVHQSLPSLALVDLHPILTHHDPSWPIMTHHNMRYIDGRVVTGMQQLRWDVHSVTLILRIGWLYLTRLTRLICAEISKAPGHWDWPWHRRGVCA